jgi:hypothetical protein
MTDTPLPSLVPPPKPAPTHLWLEQMESRNALAEQIRPVNKAVVFDVLARAGITRVLVTFDGYGDSGQIESIEARAGKEMVDLPSDTVLLADPLWDGSGTETVCLPLRDAIEKLAYDALEVTHSGWENNDGGFGDFSFDVAERTITLVYHERYTQTEDYEHLL